MAVGLSNTPKHRRLFAAPVPLTPPSRPRGAGLVTLRLPTALSGSLLSSRVESVSPQVVTLPGRRLPSLVRQTFLFCLPIALPFLACAEGAAPRGGSSTFVLRSIAGQPLPAIVLLGGTRQLVLADTLRVGAADRGVLQRSFVAATDGAGSRARRSRHDYVHQNTDFLVVFGCESRQHCPAIHSFERGVLSARELRFAAAGSLLFERVYERAP